MKTIKYLFFLVAFSSVLFYSCTDANPIKNETPRTQKSIALRTILNEVKSANNISGKTTTNPFCFDFVYPIVFSYNNGTAITAVNFQGLLEILSNESPNLYIEGIVFPFQVVVSSTGTTTTIASESELLTLIQNCGFPTLNQDLQTTFCFDIVFPIEVTAPNNQQITIGSMEELTAYLANPSNGNETQIVFPISVLYQGQVVAINSLYEFYQMINNCDATNCVCTQEYAPVCVQTPNGIVEYGNLCYALCAGYTQNDLVPCNPVVACNILNLTAVPGACNPITNSYSVTINFDVANTTATQFEVSNGGVFPIGVFPITSLPVTIDNYPASVLGAPNLNMVTIRIAENNEFCTATQQFTMPSCPGVCTCPPENNPVCVQNPSGGLLHFANPCLAACEGYTPNDFVNCGIVPNNFSTQLGSCFQITYPVGVQYNGAIVSINSDGELIPFIPSNGGIPAFNYPVVATFGNTTYTLANAAAFTNQISISCP